MHQASFDIEVKSKEWGTSKQTKSISQESTQILHNFEFSVIIQSTTARKTPNVLHDNQMVNIWDENTEAVGEWREWKGGDRRDKASRKRNNLFLCDIIEHDGYSK